MLCWLELLILVVFGDMSDSELDFEKAVPVPCSATLVARSSSQLASFRGSDGSAVAAGLRALGVVIAPGLGLSQLHALATAADCVSDDWVQSPLASCSVAAPGQKRSRKSLCGSRRRSQLELW